MGLERVNAWLVSPIRINNVFYVSLKKESTKPKATPFSTHQKVLEISIRSQLRQSSRLSKHDPDSVMMYKDHSEQHFHPPPELNLEHKENKSKTTSPPNKKQKSEPHKSNPKPTSPPMKTIGTNTSTPSTSISPSLEPTLRNKIVAHKGKAWNKKSEKK